MIKTGSYKQESEYSPRALIKQEHSTKSGETATKTKAQIDQEKIDNDSRFDGFYCNATNLFKEECTTQQIVAIGARRWEIEECFRIMKTNLKSRPFYHNKDSRITAHDRDPNGKYTVDELIHAIRNINLISLYEGKAYQPDYKNSQLITDLLEIFDLKQFGNQVVMKDTMKNILKKIKEAPEMYQEA